MGAAAYIARAWSRRELLRQLAWREAKAGRRQSLLGVAWMFVQPVSYLVVLSVVFSFIPRFHAADVPYPLLLVTALVPWLFVAGAVRAAVSSVVDMADLVRKIAFPRLFCPLSVMAAHLANLSIGIILLLGMLWSYEVPLAMRALWVVPALLVAAATAFGVGFILAAANVYTRDVQSVAPLVIQIWFFATPIVYPFDLVVGELSSRGLERVYALNPMVGVIQTMRYALLPSGVEAPRLGAAAVVAGALLLVGSIVFARLERTFADVI
jgi:lipopolysaccharide transport system permease protein